MTVDNPTGVPEAAAELIVLLADEGVAHFFINAACTRLRR